MPNSTNPLALLADELDALSEWADRQLAAGAPPKWLLQVVITGIHQCAVGIRTANADRQAGR